MPAIVIAIFGGTISASAPAAAKPRPCSDISPAELIASARPSSGVGAAWRNNASKPRL